MNRRDAALVLCALLSLAGLWATFLPGCGAPSLTLTNAVQAADVAAYAADLSDCVQGSATRWQAQACMTQVRAQWCGPGGRLQVQGGCSVDAGPVAPPMVDKSLSRWLDQGIEAGLVTTSAQKAAVGVVDAVTADAGGDR